MPVYRGAETLSETLRAIQDISKKHDIPIATYGHTVGHQSFVVDLPDGSGFVFAFDAAGIVTMRALAIGARGVNGILESARLWPTMPYWPNCAFCSDSR